MLRLAILTARKRLGTYVGAFLALFGSAVLVMAGGMLLESALRSHRAGHALRSGGRGRHRPSGRRPRPRRDPRRACAHQQRARASSCCGAGRARGDRRRCGSRPPRCARRAGARLEQRATRPVPPRRRPPARRRERSRHHVPVPPRCARASDVDGARSHRHGRRDRARAFDAARGAADLPDGLRGRAPRRPSRPSRCDRHPRRVRGSTSGASARPPATLRSSRAVRVETPSRPPSRSGARS